MTEPLREPIGFPPETVMTKEQLASALNVHVDTLDRSGIPASYALGSRTPRYIWGDVIQWMRTPAIGRAS